MQSEGVSVGRGHLMRRAPLLCLLVCGWIIGAIAPDAQAQAPATPQGEVYVITHVDFGATGDPLAEATRALREFAADSKKDPGAVRFELLQQDGRLNHFTIVSVWTTRAAFEAHSAAAHTKRFREKVQPVMGSPFDERLHSLLP